MAFILESHTAFTFAYLLFSSYTKMRVCDEVSVFISENYLELYESIDGQWKSKYEVLNELTGKNA